MTNKKSTKGALLASGISLLLCFTMLLGTTFAWFTDSVSTTNNIITAGNLDVELNYKNDEVTTWATVTGTTNVFKTGTLWEPGHTEVVRLQVENKGTLDLEYQLGVSIAAETGSVNAAGDPFKLSDYIKYAVIADEPTYANSAAAAAAAEAANPAKLNQAYSSGVINLPNGEDKIVTVIVYMPTTVGNEANYGYGEVQPTINLGISLIATQLNAEEDSFGSDYDKDATYPGEVGTVEDLANALANGESVKLSNDIVVEQPLTFAANEEVVLNLNGHTISGSEDTLIAATAGKLEITNGKIKNVKDNATETLTAVALSGNAVAEIKGVEIETTGVGIALSDNAKITELNATINSYVNANGYCAADAISLSGNASIAEISGGTYESTYTDDFIDAYTGSFSGVEFFPIRVEGSAKIIEISGGTFLGRSGDGRNGATIYLNGGKIEKISGGYFGFCKYTMRNSPYILINVNNGGTIGAITGGSFEFASGFGCDVASIIAASGKSYTVRTQKETVRVKLSSSVKTQDVQVWDVVSQ